MRNAARAIALVALTAFLAACDIGLPAGRTPHREGNRLDMVDQPKLKPQRRDIFGARPTGLMEPQPGTVAVGESPYPYAQNEADRAGAELVNPLQPSPEVIAHGKFVYENVCIACHGPKGAGDGHVTALFPKPPSLMTQKVRDWPDGQLFHRPDEGPEFDAEPRAAGGCARRLVGHPLHPGDAEGGAGCTAVRLPRPSACTGLRRRFGEANRRRRLRGSSGWRQGREVTS